MRMSFPNTHRLLTSLNHSFLCCLLSEYRRLLITSRGKCAAWQFVQWPGWCPMWGCWGEMRGRSLRLWSGSLSHPCMASTPFSFIMNGTNSRNNLCSHTHTHRITMWLFSSLSCFCFKSDYHELHHGAHVRRHLPTNRGDSAPTNGGPGVHPLQEPAASQRPHSHVPQQAVPNGAVQGLGGQPGTASVWQSSKHGRSLLVHKQLDQGTSMRRCSWGVKHQKHFFLSLDCTCNTRIHQSPRWRLWMFYFDTQRISLYCIFHPIRTSMLSEDSGILNSDVIAGAAEGDPAGVGQSSGGVTVQHLLPGHSADHPHPAWYHSAQLVNWLGPLAQPDWPTWKSSGQVREGVFGFLLFLQGVPEHFGSWCWFDLPLFRLCVWCALSSYSSHPKGSFSARQRKRHREDIEVNPSQSPKGWTL